MKSNKKQYYLNQEQWKYTKIDYFKDYNFDYSHTDNSTLNQECKDTEILIYNGQFIKAGKLINKHNIFIDNIKDALERNDNSINDYFNQVIPQYDDIYHQHNKKYFSKGYYLYIPKNCELKKPITINNILDKGDKKSFVSYRNFMFCDKNSNVKIINKTDSNIELCNNIINELYISNNSEIELINDSHKSKTKEIHTFAANLNNNSILKYHSLDFKGQFIKNNYYINLNMQGAECLFNGFNIAKSNDYIDNYIEILHNNKNTRSDLNYKVISSDSSKSILFAKAIIKKNSSNCEAYQKNHNLILSEKATIHSNPQLEIYNDDVQCSHGSTTGQIDDDIIHYMMTRGINVKDAKKLIMEGFLNDIVNNISIDSFIKNINLNIEKYLKNETF